MTVSLFKKWGEGTHRAEDMSAALKEFVEIVGNFLSSSVFSKHPLMGRYFLYNKK